MKIGENIKKCRIEKGISQAELARLLFVTPALINHYETGKRKPKLETLQRIAAALDVPISDIIPDIYPQLIKKSLLELSEKYGSNDAEYLEMRVNLDNKVDQLNKNGIQEMIHHAGILSGHPDYKK